MTAAGDSDPLLRALTTGDERCPDGRALARLGRLLRTPGAAPGDLRAQVGRRLTAVTADAAGTDDEAAIDRRYGDDLADPVGDDPMLDRLSGLVSLLAPAPADLRDRVRRQLRASLRLTPVDSERPVSSRAEAGRVAERGRRVRLVTAVIAAHVAAVLVFGIVLVNPPANDQRDGGNNGSGWSAVKPLPRLPEAAPRTWDQLAVGGFDLLALRRSPELRAAARARFGCERSTPVVARGLRWLISRQDDHGRFLPEAASAPDLRRQALATLALLGEGGGPTAADRARIAAIERALPLLSGDATPATEVCALVALARVEAALLGIGTRGTAESALDDLAHAFVRDGMSVPAAGDAIAPAGVGPSTAHGIAFLAAETARQAGYLVPPSLGEPLRARCRAGPIAGVTAFARLVTDGRPASEVLTRADPLGRVDGDGPPAATVPAPDDLSSWFATLARRETGGTAWDGWSAALQGRLIQRFADDGLDRSVVSGTADAVTATAMTVLELQVAYRYLPLAAP